jgi:glycosyltransferase involved in cell wall biosynthesis
MIEIPLRLGLQQRVFPSYRAPFFEALASTCRRGFSLCAGQPRSDEAIEPAVALRGGQLFTTRNLHLFRGSAYVCWQTGLLRWLRIWNPEALIMEANPRYLNTPLAVRWMRARRRPVIGWGLGVGSFQNGLLSGYRRRFLLSFDALIAYSARGADEYAAAGFDPRRVFVAPNAATSRPTSPPPERPEDKPAGDLTVLFVGRLQARKRVDLLIRACASLPDDIRPKLLIVGDGPERARLEGLAEREYPRTVFLGSRHGEELLPIYTQADLFVLPGTGGLAVQQAMAHALPVIVAEADGTQQDLVRAENGWVTPPGDLAALTGRLREALADLPRLRRMGASSYRVVADEVNVESMVAVFARAIESACNQYRCTMPLHDGYVDAHPPDR